MYPSCPWTDPLPGEITSRGLPASCSRQHPCSMPTALSNFRKTDNFFHVLRTYVYFQVCLLVYFFMQFYKHPWIILQYALNLAKMRPCYSHCLSALHHNHICHCGKLLMCVLHTAAISSLKKAILASNNLRPAEQTASRPNLSRFVRWITLFDNWTCNLPSDSSATACPGQFHRERSHAAPSRRTGERLAINDTWRAARVTRRRAPALRVCAR